MQVWWDFAVFFAPFRLCCRSQRVLQKWPPEKYGFTKVRAQKDEQSVPKNECFHAEMKAGWLAALSAKVSICELKSTETGSECDIPLRPFHTHEVEGTQNAESRAVTGNAISAFVWALTPLVTAVKSYFLYNTREDIYIYTPPMSMRPSLQP